MMGNPGNNYDIHIECEECGGFGKLENTIGGIDNNPYLLTPINK